MFEIEKRLKSILEGSVDHSDTFDATGGEGGMEDQMMMEAVFEMFMTESDFIPEMFNESSFEGITLAQLLREVTEKEIRDDVEKKKSRWQRFKEGFKRFWAGKFDPYSGLNELKAANELMKDFRTESIVSGLGVIGIIIMIWSRANKYKNFPESTARQYIKEGHNHVAHLKKILASLEKEPDKKKFANAIKRVNKGIKRTEEIVHEFERRAIDKAIL